MPIDLFETNGISVDNSRTSPLSEPKDLFAAAGVKVVGFNPVPEMKPLNIVKQAGSGLIESIGSIASDVGSKASGLYNTTKNKSINVGRDLLSGAGNAASYVGRNAYSLYNKAQTESNNLEDYLNKPTESPISIGDFVTNTLPTSIIKTAKGIVEFPQKVGESIAEPVAKGMLDVYHGKQTVPGAYWNIAKDELAKAYAGIKSTGEFLGKPIGTYGLDELENAWKTQPVESAMALSSFLMPIVSKTGRTEIYDSVKTVLNKAKRAGLYDKVPFIGESLTSKIYDELLNKGLSESEIIRSTNGTGKPVSSFFREAKRRRSMEYNPAGDTMQQVSIPQPPGQPGSVIPDTRPTERPRQAQSVTQPPVSQITEALPGVAPQGIPVVGQASPPTTVSGEPAKEPRDLFVEAGLSGETVGEPTMATAPPVTTSKTPTVTVKESLTAEKPFALKEAGSKPAGWLSKTPTIKVTAAERQILKEAETTTPEIYQLVRDEISKPNIFDEIKGNVGEFIKIDQSLIDHFSKTDKDLQELIKSRPGMFSYTKGSSFDEVAQSMGLNGDELSQRLKDVVAREEKLRSAERLIAEYKQSQLKPEMVNVGELKLKVGTEFKINGEKYKVIQRDENGDFVIKDGDIYTVDEFNSIPKPDEGSVKQPSSKIKQTKFEYDKTKADIRPKLESSLTNPALQHGQKGFFDKVGITPTGSKSIKKEAPNLET